MRAGRAQTHRLLAGNMAANTTAPAADTMWINVGAVRGAVPVLDFQLLEFSQRMPPRDVAMQVFVPWLAACASIMLTGALVAAPR